MKYHPYSHSKIQKAHCPYAFKRRYIDKEHGHRRGNLRFGGVVHDIMADILNARVRGQPYDVLEIVKKNTTIDLVERIDEIQGIINVFLSRFDVNFDNVVGVEEKVAINEGGYGTDWDNAYLRGILDVVEIDGTHAIITDHKTQYNILSDEDMKKNTQLTFYSLLTKAFYPQVETFTAKIYFARYGFTKSSERTIDDIRQFWDTLHIQINAIENIEEWIPIPGSTCPICEFMHECPLARYDEAGNDPPAVMTAAEAVRQAKLLRVREEQVKQAKALLAQYAAANGSIKISDAWEYGYVKRSTVEWPVSDTRQVFVRNDHSIDAHINFSKTSMKKLVSRAKRLDPDFADELESVCRNKTETTFKGHKT